LAEGDEVAFALSAQTRLAGVGVGLPGLCVADWFSHAVTRNPSDLRRHVQRIVHLCERGAPEAVHALADMFLVLGARGYALRERMLRYASPLLSAACRDWFRERLADGRAAHVALPEGCVPLLGSGATGTTRLLGRVGDLTEAEDDKASSDFLENISELILQGQFDAACDLLVDGIRVAPDNLVLQRELAKILAYRNDPEAWRACVARLRAQGVELIAELQS
jgi:hypothetical protein